MIILTILLAFEIFQCGNTWSTAPCEGGRVLRETPYNAERDARAKNELANLRAHYARADAEREAREAKEALEQQRLAIEQQKATAAMIDAMTPDVTEVHTEVGVRLGY